MHARNDPDISMRAKSSALEVEGLDGCPRCLDQVLFARTARRHCNLEANAGKSPQKRQKMRDNEPILGCQDKYPPVIH